MRAAGSARFLGARAREAGRTGNFAPQVALCLRVAPILLI